MAVYYNEIDPKAAAWLRELIKCGLIADGVVDERSIVDVEGTDLKGFTQCHFFAGIGGWSHALRLAGWPDDKPVWTGSCPCQPFSSAGKRAGFSDERHLWPAFYALIRERRPVTVFGEQVASNGGLSWLNLVRYDLERAGYICGAVDTCAAGFGAPHIRQRLYWAANAAGQQDHKEQQRPAADEGGLGADSVGGCCMDSRMADTAGIRCNEQRGAEGTAVQGKCAKREGEYAEPRQNGELPRGFEGLCRAGGMADAESFGCQCQSNIGCSSVQRTTYAACEPRQQPRPHGASPCGSANAGTTRLQVDDPRGADTGREVVNGHIGCGSAAYRPSPTNGHWRDADWLYCRDGKWRPVEPGTFPLAHGIPARVVRLRGYGNAIVPQVAAAFVAAYMEYEKTS